MSRNNLILVVCVDQRYYVVPNVCADTEWDGRFARSIANDETRKYTRSRGKALIRAHNLQNKLKTEYGVREFFM